MSFKSNIAGAAMAAAPAVSKLRLSSFLSQSLSETLGLNGAQLENSTTALNKGTPAAGGAAGAAGSPAAGRGAGGGATPRPGARNSALSQDSDIIEEETSTGAGKPVNKNLGNVKAQDQAAHPSKPGIVSIDITSFADRLRGVSAPPGRTRGQSSGNIAANPNRDKKNRSLSLVDMYIDTSEPTENVGQIQFSMEYNFNEMTLILRIMQAKELPAKDLSGTSDPYVRVVLLPDKKHKLETKIKRRTLHPKWHETFYFEGFPIQKLQSRVLHLHVFDYDRFSRDDSIGEVHIPLCQVDFSEKNSYTFWKALRPLEKNKCGDVLVSLCYATSTSELTLSVIKCRNLMAKDINGKSDPYVKVWLYFGEKRIEKRKSEVFFCELCPEFQFTVKFEVPWERIRECQLDVTIMDHDKVGRNEAIGKIKLGKAGSGTSETKHWSDMITKPRQTVVQWHRLKPE